jgi:lysophospholipase L1-like esterase
MKNRFILIAILTSVLVIGCEQEVAELTPPEEVTGEPGSADFTMFVSLGNSLTAGFQAGALFTEGQNNSYPSIMAEQFALVSENNEFNQPDINSVNGYNSTYSNPGAGVFRGRLVLFDADGAGPGTPVPAPAGTPGMPAPYNTVTAADIPAAYAGNKAELNNFGVPGILLTQAGRPETGNPASPYYNPLWARFASQPGVKSILQDALEKSPTFFSFWLGNNDVLGYATSGGAGTPLTDPGAFEDDYTDAIDQLLAVNANTKGVVATIPDVTAIPFFTTVKYNAVTLDQARVDLLNPGFAGYNAALDGLKNPAFGGAFGTAAQLDARKITYVVGSNEILIADKFASDLGAGFDQLLAVGAINQTQRDALAPFEQVREAATTDIITLSAGGVLGTGALPNIVGVTVPLADQYTLLPTEITAVKERTIAFNNIIKDVVADNTARLALADINVKFTEVVTGATRMVDGIPVNASFAPPAGLFSPDGVHPNNRGSAFIARVFVEAINAKFGATVPLPNIATYHSTGLPVSPVAP